MADPTLVDVERTLRAGTTVAPGIFTGFSASEARVLVAELDRLRAELDGARPAERGAPTLAETRTGRDWCPRCAQEAGTNRYQVTRHDYCATCGTQLTRHPNDAHLPFCDGSCDAGHPMCPTRKDTP